VLRRELEGPGWRAHTQALGASRVADHGRVNGRDGTHVRIGRNTDEGRLDTVWETIVLPPGPCAVDGRRDVATWTRRAGRDLRRAPSPTANKDENNEKSQYDNDGLHLYRL